MNFEPLTIKLGRSPGNHLIINDHKVSSRHCAITRTSEGYLIEDLGSTNGTYLNGTRIMQAEITSSDELLLASFVVNVPLVLSLFESEKPVSDLPYDQLLKQEATCKEFSALKPVYDAYIREKICIMKEGNLKSTGIKAGLSLIPVVGSALGILSSTVTGNPQEQLLELEEKFKRLYLCPGCFKFLGAEPWENLERRGFCMICKTKWKP